MDRLNRPSGEVQEKLDALDAWDLDSKLDMAMDAQRRVPGRHPRVRDHRRRTPPSALCRLYSAAAGHPASETNQPTTWTPSPWSWMEHHLQNNPGSVIACDPRPLFSWTTWPAGFYELDRGRGIPWKGNYSSWLEQKEQRLKQEEKTESERQKTLARELEWIRMSPKGRHAKGKARITAYESLLGQEGETRSKDLEIYIPPGPRLARTSSRPQGWPRATATRSWWRT